MKTSFTTKEAWLVVEALLRHESHPHSRPEVSDRAKLLAKRLAKEIIATFTPSPLWLFTTTEDSIWYDRPSQPQTLWIELGSRVFGELDWLIEPY